jgi:hypothetical protein
LTGKILDQNHQNELLDIGKKATLNPMSDITVEIHLSPDAPQEAIQQILALVVDSPTATSAAVRVEGKGTITVTGEIHPRYVQVQLVPFDAKAKFLVTGPIALLLVFAQIAYYVAGTADHTVQFLEHYRSYFQTKINGSVVPIDQAKETIKNAEHPQLTPKNEHHEKSGDPPAISSEGD